MPRSKEWQLVRRPHGWPVPEDFRLVETDVPDAGDGQLLVRNLVMSVDPYMRGRMNDAKSYAAPYQLDEPMYGVFALLVAVAASSLGDLAWYVAGRLQGHRVLRLLCRISLSPDAIQVDSEDKLLIQKAVSATSVAPAPAPSKSISMAIAREHIT